ncbi:hypothetical protein RJ640_000152 [Escallonia rubra]|uniref:Polygalacturonase n=1 Tax=Escallonia rubra TaxID=112253 RepID=A0AA88QXQ0_9ASTE|nr:hypothetical protein RJ640_000152 [Escallonia rubra]
MAKHISFLVIALVLNFFNTSLAIPVTYNVLSLGAKPDGKTDSTKSLISAWAAACGSPRPATIYVPPGRYFVQQVHFRGACQNKAIMIRIDGTLVAPSDYNALRSVGNWILFEGVNGVTISGGILDGQGTGLWACKTSSKLCPSGATGVKVLASGTSPNTDGIHVQLSSGVSILRSKISTGDDCVSIGPGTANLWIENVVCGPGHGISIGSLGKDLQEAGVQNVTIKTVTFKGTQNGLRIKAWGRPSSGFVQGVLFQHAVMINVQNPIVIDQNYCPHNLNCPGQDIHGTPATPVAVKFDCSRNNPCTGIRLEDVKLTYQNQPAAASCANAGGTSSGLVEPTSCL